MSSLKVAISVEEIKMRLTAFVYSVQDCNRFASFKPGTCWWLASSGVSAKDKHPNVVDIYEQMGVTVEDMIRCFG